jgi:hypothetical protein
MIEMAKVLGQHIVKSHMTDSTGIITAAIKNKR